MSHESGVPEIDDAIARFGEVLRKLEGERVTAKRDWPEPKHEITVTGKDIPPDEPLFLLRGQDEFAPRAIEAYADELEIAAAKHAEVLEDEKELTLLEQAVQVRAHALAMRRWQLENPGRTKRPD